MKKVYYAKREMKKEADVIFLSDKSGSGLKYDANKFLEEEIKNYRPSMECSIVELKTVADVPDNWRDAYIWGSEDNVTVAEALSVSDPEYKEYLRLKDKYEKNVSR